MRSSEALSFLGALCLIFGLGLATYQVVLPEAVSHSTSTGVQGPSGDADGSLALQRARPGLIVLGVGAGLLLAGALLERRSG
jgi:hypothetical protein